MAFNIKGRIKYLTQKDIFSLKIPMETAVTLVEEVFNGHGEGEVILPPKVILKLDERYKGHTNVMPAYVGSSHTVGTKFMSPHWLNPNRGLPNVVGIMVTMDAKTGVPNAIMDARYITLLRTGAVSGVSAKYFAKKTSSVIGIIGAGAVAPYHALAICQVLSIKKIKVYDLSEKAIATFARLLSSCIPSVKVEPCKNYDEVIMDSDIVVSCARMRQDQTVIRKDNIAKGALILETGERRTIEEDLPKIADKFIVDDWNQCQSQGGCLWELVGKGEITSATIYANIGDVVAGKKPGRESNDELVVGWFRGMGCEDIAIANELVKRANEMGIGLDLPIEYADDITTLF